MADTINDRAARPEAARAGWFRTLLVSLFILSIGAALIWFIFRTEPTATRSDNAREGAMPVSVTEVETGNYRPTITAMGRVRPAREVVLRPRISGRILDHADELTPGGIVTEGETLVRIDSADYEAALEQRESELRQARADLRIEQGQKNVAETEFELLKDDLPSANKALILREPQGDAAEAAVASAQAAVRRARLDLERTTVSAPFDARVLSRDVTIGSQVNAGDALARLVGVETYWVETTIPQDKLRWLSFAEQGGTKGAPVRIRNNTAWPEGVHRKGRLYRLVGELDQDSRMARVLITVDDPVARTIDDAEVPPLLINAFVENHIQGRPIQNVAKLNRDYVRRDDTAWVMDEGRLSIRNLGIAFRDADHAYIRSGLDDGDQVVTSNLATVTEGARLRLEDNAQ